MNISNELITNAIKKALEANNVKSIPGVDIDDLVKSITESVLSSLSESADIKSVGLGLMKGIQSALNK